MSGINNGVGTKILRPSKNNPFLHRVPSFFSSSEYHVGHSLNGGIVAGGVGVDDEVEGDGDEEGTDGDDVFVFVAVGTVFVGGGVVTGVFILDAIDLVIGFTDVVLTREASYPGAGFRCQIRVSQGGGGAGMGRIG